MNKQNSMLEPFEPTEKRRIEETILITDSSKNWVFWVNDIESIRRLDEHEQRVPLEKFCDAAFLYTNEVREKTVAEVVGRKRKIISSERIVRIECCPLNFLMEGYFEKIYPLFMQRAKEKAESMMGREYGEGQTGITTAWKGENRVMIQNK